MDTEKRNLCSLFLKKTKVIREYKPKQNTIQLTMASGPGSYDYLSTIFDPGRFGFRAVAERIILSLDYHSLIRFKRSCKLVCGFLAHHPHLERDGLERKLDSDWGSKVEPRERRIEITGEVGNVKFFDSDRRLLVSVDKWCATYRVATGKQERLFKSGGHSSSVMCCDVDLVDGGLVASGDRDGMLLLWDLATAKRLCKRRLFGKLQTLKWGPNRLLVTGHIGQAFDMGCISVREFRSPDEIPVLFSMYQNLLPICSLDFNETHMVFIEWTGTYFGVHEGKLSLHHWLDERPLVHKLANSPFTQCRLWKEDFLLATGPDKEAKAFQLHLYKIFDRSLHCVRILDFHKSPILSLEVCLGRALTRDIRGQNCIWDLKRAMFVGNPGRKRKQHLEDKEREGDGRGHMILRKSQSKTFENGTGVDLGRRGYVVGFHNVHLSVYDVWSDA